MIKLVELECPNCGGMLEKTGEDSARCPHCNAQFLIDKGTPREVNYIYQPKPETGKVMLILILIGCIIMIPLLVFQSMRNDDSTIQTEYVQETIEPEGIQSEVFQKFVELVFQVTYEKVTDEQLAGITYLQMTMGRDYTVVEYAIQDGEYKTVELEADLSFNCEDIQYFKGLKELYMPSAGLVPGSLDGLENLTAVSSYNSPQELAQIVPNPEKITVLECKYASDIAGIDAFVNLESLLLGDSELSDISILSAMKNLKQLTIERGDAIADFGVLYSLANLEKLSIDSEGLKDVSFLESMPQLKELSIKDSVVLDMSALEKATSLTYLELTGNDEVQDYSVLSSLGQLETLIVELGSTEYMPSVENWSKLTTLSVSGVEDISFLTSLPELQNLTITYSDCSNYSVFTSLQKLESLKLNGIYGEIQSLEGLTQLEGLKSLDISSMTIYGDVEYLFAIPQLEELNLDDCSFGLNFSNIAENTSLKRLYMDRLSVWENIQVQYDGALTYLDYDEVNLADHISFVGNFPNLEEIYLQGNKLTDLNFTEGIPNLRKIDITNNYVTDLRPLGKLPQLETVWCGENAISQGKELGENVVIIFDSEADSGW